MYIECVPAVLAPTNCLLGTLACSVDRIGPRKKTNIILTYEIPKVQSHHSEW